MMFVKLLTVCLNLALIAKVNGNFVDDLGGLVNRNLALDFYRDVSENRDSYLVRSSEEDDTECFVQLNGLFEDLKAGKMWSLEVIDSWGKIPAGIMQGHLKELGNFDQCMNVKADSTAAVPDFKGKYCTLILPISKLLEDLLPKPGSGGASLPKNIELSSGICIPNICRASVVNGIVKNIFNITQSDPTVFIYEESCHKNEAVPKTTAFYIAIVLFSIFAALLLFGTLYEYGLEQRGDASSPSFPLLAAFSIKSNGKKLFRIEDYSNSPNVIQCLNGIRCLSIIMVLFGHEYGFAIALNFINPKDILAWEKAPFSFVVRNLTLAVDTFFVLSGCLLIWSAFKEMDKTKGKLNIPLMYFHRYIRLTPVVAMAILIALGIYPHLGEGPNWNLSAYLPACEKYWWTTLLYVQNYVNVDTMCLPHTWYLAVDTHFYILSPILIIPMYRWGIVGIIPGVLASIGSIVYVFITWMNNGFHVFMQERTEIDAIREKLVYLSTHSRIPSYVIGVALGYIMYKLRNRSLNLSKIQAILAWLASLMIIAAILFGFYPKAQNLPNPTDITAVEGALFESLSRVSWAIAVAWIIFACHKGYGGVVNTFLSWGIWQPLARLSYSVYITHALVTMLIIQTTKTDVYFSDVDMMFRFWPTFGFTLLLSVIFVLAFELPVLGIEKALFGKKQKKSVV